MEDAVRNSFEKEMHDIYYRALKEAHYKATRYFQMIMEHGGLETAKILINTAHVSDGYTALWERNRLDLTVEALIHDNPKYHHLFTEEELKIIRKRLIDYEYKPALGSK